MRLAPSLHRLGSDRVNCYLVEEAGSVTIVDAGVPGYYDDLIMELDAMGRSIDDVKALVLTHGHSDHIGFAERVRSEDGIGVSVHELDAALAKGETGNPSAGMGNLKLPSFMGFLLWSARRGALRVKPLTEVATFGDGTTLDVPGALQVIHTPGHTPGNVALHASGVSALLAGDTLSTLAVTTGVDGPQISPFSADPDQALASLASIEEIDADWLLTGHGAPWQGGVGAAVEQARAFGVEHLARP